MSNKLLIQLNILETFLISLLLYKIKQNFIYIYQINAILLDSQFSDFLCNVLLRSKKILSKHEEIISCIYMLNSLGHLSFKLSFRQHKKIE